MTLTFQLFHEAHFKEYQSWFKDPDLQAQLGPMDEEWKEAVLTETDGYTYSVLEKEQLVAVVGIKFPSVGYPAYYITDIAVRPQLRGKGIGKAVLEQLERLHPLEVGQTWRAFVAINNPKAKLFFEKNGWQQKGQRDEDGMYMLELTNHHLPVTNH